MNKIINKIIFITSFLLLKVFCYGQENVLIKEVKSDFSKLTLDVIKDNKTIQKIDYDYSKECLENAVFIEKKYELIDVNFDGFNDILIYLGSYGNQGIAYKEGFLWNKEKQKFIQNNLIKSIPDLQIDSNKKYLYGSLRDQASHFIYEMYSWNGEALVLNYRIHKLYSAEQLNDIYKFNIPDNEDCGEYILKYFGLNNELYDSIFFVKTYYINGKECISEPSIRLFEEIPVKLKSLIND